jgi:hypothetical protein
MWNNLLSAVWALVSHRMLPRAAMTLIYRPARIAIGIDTINLVAHTFAFLDSQGTPDGIAPN